MGRLVGGGVLEEREPGQRAAAEADSPICSRPAEGHGRRFHPSGKKEGGVCRSRERGESKHAAAAGPSPGCWLPCRGWGRQAGCRCRDFPPRQQVTVAVTSRYFAANIPVPVISREQRLQESSHHL